MTKIYNLAYIRKDTVFDAAEAINDIGAFAIAPRAFAMVRDRRQNGKHVPSEVPALDGYFFVCSTTPQWHAVMYGLRHQGKVLDVRMVREMDPREWQTVRDFAEIAEANYLIEAELANRRDAVDEDFGFTPQDALQLLSPSLRDTMAADAQAQFVGVVKEHGKVMIQAEVQMMGRTVKVKADPLQVVARKVAAE